MKYILILSVCLLISSPVFASEGGVLPAGATLLNISATERIEVEQDILVANLRLEKRLEDPKELQQDINIMMKKAVEEAKKFEGIDLTTQQYYVHEYYNQKNDPRMWQGSQGLMIQGKNSEDVLELSGRLQDIGFMMNGLSYQLSPEKREEVRDGLLENALKKLIARAQRVGSTIDKPSVDLWEVNVDAAPSMPMPSPMMARGMVMAESAMMDSAAAPVAEAGKDQISMTVSAKVILK